MNDLEIPLRLSSENNSVDINRYNNKPSDIAFFGLDVFLLVRIQIFIIDPNNDALIWKETELHNGSEKETDLYIMM